MGYSLGLPGLGVSEPIGTPYNPNQTPYSVYNATQGYSNPLPTTYNATTSPMGYTPATNSGRTGSVLGASTKKTTDNLSGTLSAQSQQPQQDPYAGMQNAAQSAADAQLSSLQTEWDRNKANLEGQLSGLGTQRQSALENMGQQLSNLQNQVGSARQSAQESAASNIADAGSIARSTQAKNRNTLRALGILSSSAAGDILSQPMNAFGQERAKIESALAQRNKELDDTLVQKTAEHSQMVKDLESQYAQLTSQIQSDLRFSDRERANAIAAANAAAQQRMAEIQTAQATWNNQVQAQKQNLALTLAQLGGWKPTSADLGRISGTLLSGVTPNYTTQQTSIVGDQQKRDIYGNLI